MRAHPDRLLVDGRPLDVEIVRHDVQGYTLRAALALGVGERVELVVAEQSPVPCVVEKVAGDVVRLRRGWGPASPPR